VRGGCILGAMATDHRSTLTEYATKLAEVKEYL
jgi:hypothetical protein